MFTAAELSLMFARNGERMQRARTDRRRVEPVPITDIRKRSAQSISKPPFAAVLRM